MDIDFFSLDSVCQLGESATGRSRGFGSHAIRLRSSTGLQASTRPARTIAHFSGPPAVERGIQATCRLPAQQCSPAREHSCPTGPQALLLLVECSPRRWSRVSGSMLPACATVCPCKGKPLPYRAVGVAPSQRAGKMHTRTCPTAESRLNEADHVSAFFSWV